MDTEDENKPDLGEELWKKQLLENAERANNVEKIREETKHRLETDAAIQEYFKQFHSGSIESFISNYSHLKGSYMEYGEGFGKETERRNLEQYENAEKGLKLIQLKKLFDLRCQWGANMIKLEGIDISWDFLIWTNDIFNCPFLSPITQQEYDLYYKFTLSNDFELESHYDWFDILNIRSWQEDEVGNLPEWFYFHNTYTGASSYFGLPDTRFDKENYYRDIAFEKRDAEIEKKYESGELQRYVPDTRPWMVSYSFDEVERFVKLFEEDKTKARFYDFENFMGRLSRNTESDDDYLNEKAGELASDLAHKKIVLPVEANPDWRRALINAWDKYQKDLVRTALPLAFEDYLFRIENNIGVAGNDDEYKNENSNNVKAQILEGRELKGEPRDFYY